MEEKRTGNNSPNDPVARSAAAARWSDPKAAALALLSPGTHRPAPVAASTCAPAQPNNVDGNALESAGRPANPGRAARWDDLEAAAQALLAPAGWPGLFVADPLEQLQDSLEGGAAWNEAAHTRGGNPENTGEFSKSPGGGATTAPPQRAAISGSAQSASAAAMVKFQAADGNRRPEGTREQGRGTVARMPAASSRAVGAGAPPSAKPEEKPSPNFWAGAATAAAQQGIPPFLMHWNKANGTTIINDGTGPSTRGGIIRYPDYTNIFRLNQIGKGVAVAARPTLGSLYNEAFHAWFKKVGANTQWLGGVIGRQAQFGKKPAEVSLLSEEAMSELIDLVASTDPTKIPTYAEIIAGGPKHPFYHVLTPGHNEPGGYLATFPGSSKPMSEELYYATIWVLHHGDKDPAPNAKSNAERLAAMKRFFAQTYRKNWTKAQVDDFAK